MVVVAKEKRKSGRPPKHPPAVPVEGSRTGVPINIRIDPALHALVPKYRAKFREEHDVRLSMTDVFEQALVRLFRDAGLEPPPRA